MSIFKRKPKPKPRIARCGNGIVIVNKQGKVLLGKRHDDPIKADSDLHGEGTWSLPGGKIDFGEKAKDSIWREVYEETSIRLNKNKMKIITIQDEIVPDAHYLTLGWLCRDFLGEAKVMEPDEMTKWKWFDINNLPSPLYKPAIPMLKTYKKKHTRKKGFFRNLF
jgi:8-oxo-dGTP diphosphatase